jgi:hypothetical protein
MPESGWHSFWGMFAPAVALHPKTLAWDALFLGVLSAASVLFARAWRKSAQASGFRMPFLAAPGLGLFFFGVAGVVLGAAAANHFRSGEVTVPPPEPGIAAAGALLLLLAGAALAAFILLFLGSSLLWYCDRPRAELWRPCSPRDPSGEYRSQRGGRRAARRVAWSEQGIEVELKSGAGPHAAWDEIARVKQQVSQFGESRSAFLVVWIHLRSGERFSFDDRGADFLALADALYCHCPSAYWLSGWLNLPSQRAA